MTAPAILAAGPFAAYPTTASVSYQMPLGAAQGNITTAGISNRLNLVKTAGVINNLYVTLGATNARTTDTIFTVYKNGSATALSVTIAAGALAGAYTDLSNTVTVASGDDISVQVDMGTGAGAITVNGITATFTASSGTSQILASANAAGNTLATAATRYMTVAGTGVLGTTEPATQIYMAVPGNMTGINVYVSANSFSSATVRLRKNAGNVNGIISIGASASGLLSDLSNTDALVAGDLMALQLITTGAGSITVLGGGATFDAANDTESNLVLNSPVNVTTSSPNMSMFGRYRFTGVEAATQTAIGVPGSIDKGSIEVTSNASAAQANLRFRKNGATGNLNIVITASTTGTYQDMVSAADAVVASDLVNLQMQNATGTIQVRNFSARFVTAAIGGTVYNVGVAETFTVADSQATTAILPSAVNDNASAADTTSNNAVLPSARADTLAPTDTQATTAILPSAVADTITLTDAPSNVAILPSTIAESAPVTDQEQTNGPQAVAVAETITLTDQFTAQLVTNPAIAESAPVTSAQSAAVVLNLSITEAASLADTVAAQLAAFLSMQEAANAQGAPAAQLIANIAIQEALDLQDAVSQAGAVLVASKCNILAGAPRTRTLTGAPRVRLLHGGCC